jgi:hypothetical protein
MIIFLGGEFRGEFHDFCRLDNRWRGVIDFRAFFNRQAFGHWTELRDRDLDGVFGLWGALGYLPTCSVDERCIAQELRQAGSFLRFWVWFPFSSFCKVV